jgi:hypothetical protein
MSYNPKKEIFTVLKGADRPLSGQQIFQALKHIPIPKGTVSSSLSTLVEAKLVSSEKKDKMRAAQYRAVAKELPEEMNGEGRLDAPVVRKTTRIKKKDAVLLMIPLPKGQSAVVSMEEARAIYDALAPIFKG